MLGCALWPSRRFTLPPSPSSPHHLPGDIFVESEVSVGSTFTVWLPINQKGSPLRVEEGEAV